jgi:hypothetical protein
MNKDNILGFMFGVSFGVAFGFLLRPSHELLKRWNSPPFRTLPVGVVAKER